MPDLYLRAIVQRLLSGELRLHDLNTLVLALRSKTDGRKTIKEIGDFIAHREGRFRGLIADEVQEWFYLTRTTAHYINNPIDLDDLHPNFLTSLEITISRMVRKEISRETGMSRGTAYRILKELIARAKNENGKISLKIESEQERRLILVAASKLVVRPAFDDLKLFGEFVAVLRSQGLLQKHELTNLRYLKPILSRYAVSLMHRCAVHLRDGSRYELLASPNFHDKKIGVMVAVNGYPEGHRMHHVKMACAIFTANVDPFESCDPSLLTEPIDWSAVHIEVSPTGRLTRLV